MHLITIKMNILVIFLWISRLSGCVFIRIGEQNGIVSKMAPSKTRHVHAYLYHENEFQPLKNGNSYFFLKLNLLLAEILDSGR